MNLRHYIEQLVNGYEWKITLSVLGTVLSLIEGFYGELLKWFVLLFLLDLISGIWKSKKNGVPITSRRLRESVTKLGAYMVLITALIIASKFEPTFVPLVTGAYYYFGFTELKSIFENVEELGLKLPKFLKREVDSKVSQYDDTDNKK